MNLSRAYSIQMICFGFIAFVSFACQETPSYSREVAAAEAAEKRDQWWAENQQTEVDVPNASVIQSETDVAAIQQRLKSDPFAGCSYTDAARGDQKALETVELINPRSRIVSGLVTVNGSGSLSLSGTHSKPQLVNVFNVLSTIPNNASGQAVKLAEKGSATTDFTGLSHAEVQGALGATAAQPICDFLMAKSLRSLSADGASYVQASFDKAVPVMIDPQIAPGRLKLQLANPLKIANITATLETNDPDVVLSGLTKRGDIELSLIPSSRTYEDSFGEKVMVSGQVAYRVSNKFQSDDGGAAPALLDQVADYYLANGELAYVVMLTPLPELPIVIFKLSP